MNNSRCFFCWLQCLCDWGRPAILNTSQALTELRFFTGRDVYIITLYSLQDPQITDEPFESSQTPKETSFCWWILLKSRVCYQHPKSHIRNRCWSEVTDCPSHLRCWMLPGSGPPPPSIPYAARRLSVCACAHHLHAKYWSSESFRSVSSLWPGRRYS